MKEIIDSLENVDQNKKFEIEKHILKKHGIRVSTIW